MATVLFRLREYDEAFRDVLQRLMRAHADATDLHQRPLARCDHTLY